MVNVINAYNVRGRLIDTMRINARKYSISIIQNDFLPDNVDCRSNGSKIISIVNGDDHESLGRVLPNISNSIWPTVIILRNLSMRISMKYIQAGALDCVSSSIRADLLLAKCINIFRFMEKFPADDLIDDTRAVLFIDQKKRIIRANNGDHIKLTASEVTFLGLLAERRNECLSRDELLSMNITGNDATYRSLNVLISRLRTKLGNITRTTVIDSVRGAGYALGSSVELSNEQVIE